MQADMEIDPYLRRQDKRRRQQMVKQRLFVARLRQLYPSFPGDPLRLARQATHKERILTEGRLDLDRIVGLAVGAYARHTHTDYDTLLQKGMPRSKARQAIYPKYITMLKQWQKSSGER